MPSSRLSETCSAASTSGKSRHLMYMHAWALDEGCSVIGVMLSAKKVLLGCRLEDAGRVRVLCARCWKQIL